MLETIYEVDETKISDENDDDLSKFSRQSPRLSYYICLCMITGCFVALTLIIAISLNPSLLSNRPTYKSSKSLPVNTDNKLSLSTSLIEHLHIFSNQINEQLNLRPNTIKFFISTTSTSSPLENANQNDIGWIYSYIEYPRVCVNNQQCKENFHSKLKITFTKLSEFLKRIELDSSYNKQLQLDWCNLIDNSSKAILVSLVSIKPINQSQNESIVREDRITCENIDQNVLLLPMMNNRFQQDSKNNKINIHEDEINVSESNSMICSKYKENNQCTGPTDCPNDIRTKILLMWNSI